MFNPTSEEILKIAEAAKKVMQKEVDEPKAKGEKDFVDLHKKNVKVTDEPNDEKPLKVPMKMSEGKMNQLHQLVSKGVKDPKKIAKELGLPNTKEVHKSIASLVAGMKESKLDPVNKKAVKKKFANRKDKDIDNDGDVDSSDEYLHKRRKAISKATSENKKKIAEAASFSEFKSEPHLDSLDEAIEYIAEHGDIDNLTEEQLDEVIATIAKGVGAVAKGAGKLAAKGAKKVTQRLSTTGRADAAEKKAKSIEKKNADKERLKRAKERIAAAKAKAKDEKDKTSRAKERKKIAQAKAKEDMKKRAERSKKMKKEEDNLEEKNDALYLIYKDKIKAQQVRNFIKKMYRNKTEVEYAPMDAKNFGVSVFSDRGQADKVKKAVDKKFGKPDDFMLEQV
jgi:hypothetical protein